MTVAEIFESRKNDSRWNTSYPLSPEAWEKYRVSGALPFDEDNNISFYIHIPFCRQLCSFCEYTRMLCPEPSAQKKYLHSLASDIYQFKHRYKSFILSGFDIGGGTPTSLSEDVFPLLMNVCDEVLSGVSVSSDFEPSIEGSFDTLSVSKLSRIVKSGIYRLSLGVQSSNVSLLHRYARENLIERELDEWLKIAFGEGIKKVNLDFMYGLKGQDSSTINKDLELIGKLHPQQVTLYELRTNMISIREVLSKEELFAQYSQYYTGLISLGYYARFGQNTFSVDPDDKGVSSYIRHRMLDGVPYKGFGISAQSMSSSGISYNIGKMSVRPKSFLERDGYPEEYTYILPPKELASKYLAISAYNGSFSIKKLAEYGIQEDSLNEAVDYCISEGFLYRGEDSRMFITKKGFKYYGAVFSLFYASDNMINNPDDCL